jgi:hypothetical protein
MDPELIAKIKAFDELPNDAIVPDPVAAAVLNLSVWTLRRNNPTPQIPLSARRKGRRVGDIRALVRGAAPVPA